MVEDFPKTNDNASNKLLFPLPFGPATTLKPSKNGIDTFFLKDLKPCMVSLVILVLMNSHKTYGKHQIKAIGEERIYFSRNKGNRNS